MQSLQLKIQKAKIFIFIKVSVKKIQNLMVRENYFFYYQITTKPYLANGFKKVYG